MLESVGGGHKRVHAVHMHFSRSDKSQYIVSFLILGDFGTLPSLLLQPDIPHRTVQNLQVNVD